MSQSFGFLISAKYTAFFFSLFGISTFPEQKSKKNGGGKPDKIYQDAENTGEPSVTD